MSALCSLRSRRLGIEVEARLLLAEDAIEPVLAITEHADWHVEGWRLLTQTTEILNEGGDDNGRRFVLKSLRRPVAEGELEWLVKKSYLGQYQDLLAISLEEAESIVHGPQCDRQACRNLGSLQQAHMQSACATIEQERRKAQVFYRDSHVGELSIDSVTTPWARATFVEVELVAFEEERAALVCGLLRGWTEAGCGTVVTKSKLEVLRDGSTAR